MTAPTSSAPAAAVTVSHREVAMSRLRRLHVEHQQSPWLDNLTRGYLHDGTLAAMVHGGIRSVTANPTIFARAITGSADYDEEFSMLIKAGRSVEAAYWELVISDVNAALGVLRPVFDDSGGRDGFVSVEVAPELAAHTHATITAARYLHERIDAPNLLVKVPATAQGVAAIEALIAEGRNINITLIFSLSRYAEVVDAYLAGLDTLVRRGGNPATVHSVASFFISRVDAEVDARLDSTGDSDTARALQGRAAVAQAKLAYRMFRDRFSGQRWERLAALGAHVQRPLWASTATKDPSHLDTLYVDSLIGPDTGTTLPESVIAAFEDHGSVSRTLDTDVEEAADVMRLLAAAGIDMDDVGSTLERQGVDSFHRSFQEVLSTLDAKARHLLGS